MSLEKDYYDAQVRIATIERLCQQQHEALKQLVGEIVKDGGKRPYDTSMNLSRAVLTAYDALFPAKKGGAE